VATGSRAASVRMWCAWDVSVPPPTAQHRTLSKLSHEGRSPDHLFRPSLGARRALGDDYVCYRQSGLIGSLTGKEGLLSANGRDLGVGRAVTMTYWCHVCKDWTSHVGIPLHDRHDGDGSIWLWACIDCGAHERRLMGVGLDPYSCCEGCFYKAYRDAEHRPLYGVLPDQVILAGAWLQGVLGPSPVPVSWIKPAAPVFGYRWRTLEKVKDLLEIDSDPEGGETWWVPRWHR